MASASSRPSTSCAFRTRQSLSPAKPIVIERLDGIVGGTFGNAQLVDMFRQADVGGPACQVLAGCDVDGRHLRTNRRRPEQQSTRDPRPCSMELSKLCGMVRELEPLSVERPGSLRPPFASTAIPTLYRPGSCTATAGGGSA
jgi:hypothetical protein